MKEPTIFVIYFRRDTGKFYIKNIDENKEKYFIFVLLDQPQVNKYLTFRLFKEKIHYFLYLIIILKLHLILSNLIDLNFISSKKLTLSYGQGNNSEVV